MSGCEQAFKEHLTLNDSKGCFIFDLCDITCPNENSCFMYYG